jgi:hypothetical protein
MRSDARHACGAALSWALLPVIAAAAGACYKKNDYNLTAPNSAAILNLQSATGATSIPADGVSRLTLVARISPNTDPDKRDVVFTTSAGTLAGGVAGSNSGERVVTAAGNGQAPIELQSSTTAQAAVVTASARAAAGVVAALTVQFVAVGPNDVVRFVNAPGAAVPADGVTVTPFTVAVSPQLINQQVTFKASAGTFSDSPASVDVNGTATAHLISPATPGPATVTATINGFSASAPVQFAPALPTAVTIAVDNPVLTASNTSKATVTARLLRTIGNVSVGTIASFSATDATGAAAGSFTATQVATADATGTVTTSWFPGAAAKPGTQVTIRVTAPSTGGGTVSASIVVQIVGP